jgi:hypothetical protein
MGIHPRIVVRNMQAVLALGSERYLLLIRTLKLIDSSKEDKENMLQTAIRRFASCTLLGSMGAAFQTTV